MSRSLVKRILKVVVCSALGAVVGVYAVAEIQDWLDRAETMRLEKEIASHAMSDDKPPSPESFYPVYAVSRPPVVSGFKILSVAEAVGRVSDDEWVLALEIDGEARAYPLNVMHGPEREVFNDELAGRAIAATW